MRTTRLKRLACRLRAHLQALATQRLPITYREAAKGLLLAPPNTIHQVTEALEQLMAEDVAADRPFIAAMVISKARGGLPAPGYFDCAARLGRFAGDANAALTAAALMGMNNVWYPYVEMADDADLKTQRAELRMNAYATHGGVDKRRFELFALAASIVGKCHFCVASHYKTLKEIGMSAVQLRDVGRIAAAVNAAAQVLVAEDA